MIDGCAAPPRRVVMVTECSMADNVQAELPDVRVRTAVQSLPEYETDHAAEEFSTA